MRTLPLLAVVAFAHGSALSAQANPPDTATAKVTAPYRSPSTARFLGTVFPGGGHIYAGEYANGARYYYGTVCGIGGGALLIGLGVAVWAHGAIDAPRAAARANVKHSNPAGHLSLVFKPGGTAPRRTNLGLAVAW